MTALSPCVGVCRLNPDTGLCEGCRRTISEIAEWPGYDDDRRRAVLAALPERGPSARRGDSGAAAPPYGEKTRKSPPPLPPARSERNS